MPCVTWIPSQSDNISLRFTVCSNQRRNKTYGILQTDFSHNYPHTYQQIQAVYVRLYIVQVFRSYTSKVFKFGASYFPYSHRKRNHPFYTLLYLPPFITWMTRHMLICLNVDSTFLNTLDFVYKCQYLKLSVSTQMRRSDTKQKLQVLHMYIPSSQYPAHRDPRATKQQMFSKFITRTLFFPGEIAFEGRIQPYLCYLYEYLLWILWQQYLIKLI